MRGVGSRAAADRHDCVRRTGDDHHRDVDRFEASGRKAGPSAGAIANTRAHALVAVGAAVIR
jgi:hypothetical protein